MNSWYNAAIVQSCRLAEAIVQSCRFAESLNRIINQQNVQRFLHGEDVSN